MFIVEAAASLVIKPEARSAIVRALICLAGLIIGEKLRQEVGSIPFEPFPRVFAFPIEHPVKRGT